MWWFDALVNVRPLWHDATTRARGEPATANGRPSGMRDDGVDASGHGNAAKSADSAETS